MPDFMLKKYLKKYNLTKSDHLEMAKIFGVSDSGMEHTLLHLN